MPLFKKGALPEAIAPRNPRGAESTQPGPARVDRAAFVCHLDDEIWRASRYGRPLAVVCFAPRMLVNERLTSTERADAIEALGASLRRSDICAEVSDGVFAAALPETDAAEAQAAASRLRSGLAVRRAESRRINWLVGAAPLTPEETAEALIQAALDSMHA